MWWGLKASPEETCEKVTFQPHGDTGLPGGIPRCHFSVTSFRTSFLQVTLAWKCKAFAWKCNAYGNMDLVAYIKFNSYILKMGLRMSVGRELSTSSHFDPNILLSFTPRSQICNCEKTQDHFLLLFSVKLLMKVTSQS